MATLRAWTRTTAGGTTLLGLQRGAERTGFEAVGAAGSYEDLLAVDLPCIAHVVLPSGLRHYLVVYEADPTRVLVGDPGRGLVRMAAEEFRRIWTSNAVLLLTPTGSLPKDPPPSWVDWILGYTRKEQTWVVQSVFVGAAYAALGLLTAVFIQLLLDRFIPGGDLRRVLAFGAGLAGLQLLRGMMGFARRRLLVELGRRVGIRMGRDFFTHLFRLPFAFFESRKTGDITGRLHDAVRLQGVLTTILGAVVIDLLVVLGSLVMLFLLAPPFGWWAVATLPPFAALILLSIRNLEERQHEMMEAFAQLESAYIDALGGIRDILAFRASRIFSESTASAYETFQNSGAELGFLEARFSLASDTASGVVVVGSLTLGAYLVTEGSLEVGAMVAGLSLLMGVLPALSRILLSSIPIRGAEVALARLMDLLLVAPEEPVSEPGKTRVETITVRDGDFTWPNGEFALKGLNLRLEPGVMTGLYGANGSGKSTLALVLQRQYPLTGGELLGDGVRAEDWQLDEWRRSVAIVPANTEIFAGSLMENLLLGRRGIPPERVLAELARHGLAGYWRGFPGGLLTPVGQRGRHLSDGERQAVGLGRALLGEPSVLIIDESLAHLDMSTRNLFLGVLRRYSRNAAVLLISHNPADFAQADQVHRIDRGRITRSGSPRELGFHDASGMSCGQAPAVS